MAQDFDRIRILWIDDLPNRQSSDLGALAHFFEIVGRTDRPCWIRSIDDYKELRSEYKQLKEKCNVGTLTSLPYFPVEIISADYDLSKFSGNDSIGSINIESINSIGGASLTPQSFLTEESLELALNDPDREGVNHDDFQGCLINLFYLIEFNSHPCGSVVTTYQEPIRQKLAAKQIESFLEEIYGIDPLYPAKRCWDLIIKAGVKALRKRIRQLYEDNKVVLSVSDLIAMANGSTNGVLTLQSEFAIRRLPVAGLFIDIEDVNERTNLIKNWAADLLSSKVSLNNFKVAEAIAQRLWKTYNNDELVEAHQDFSRLHLAIYEKTDSNTTPDEKMKAKAKYKKRYKEYEELFVPKKTGKGKNNDTYQCMSDLCLDISSIQIPVDKKNEDTVIRWAVIFLTLKLIGRIMTFSIKKKDDDRLLMPDLTVDDILLLLYPVPKSPFPLPWHISDSRLQSSKKEAWRKWLGSRDVNLQDMLNGTGLTPGERSILQGIVMNSEQYNYLGSDPESRQEVLKTWIFSKQFIFGS